MWELCMHPDYDHLYIPLMSKKEKFQPQTNIIPGNSNPFSIKPIVVWVKISEKKKSVFPVWDLVTTDYQIERNIFCY